MLKRQPTIQRSDHKKTPSAFFPTPPLWYRPLTHAYTAYRPGLFDFRRVHFAPSGIWDSSLGSGLGLGLGFGIRIEIGFKFGIQVCSANRIYDVISIIWHNLFSVRASRGACNRTCPMPHAACRIHWLRLLLLNCSLGIAGIICNEIILFALRNGLAVCFLLFSLPLTLSSILLPAIRNWRTAGASKSV